MKQVIWTKCIGEAHSNPHIDHCAICMPYWGEYPRCPYCASTMLTCGGTKRTLCRKCGKWSSLKREPEALDLSHIDTTLDAGDSLALTAALDNLNITINRVNNALGAMDKVTEFENLRAGFEALKRAEETITHIMFRFVGK